MGILDWAGRMVGNGDAQLVAARAFLVKAQRGEVADLLAGWYEHRGFQVFRWPAGGVVDIELRRERSRLIVTLEHLDDIRVTDVRVQEVARTRLALGARSAILITAGTFTWAAQECASDAGVELLDHEDLAHLVASALSLSGKSSRHMELARGAA